jgi:hypothetical protein
MSVFQDFEGMKKAILKARSEAKKQSKNDIDLISFTKKTFSGYQVNWHHRLIAKHLEDWYQGVTPRLMLFMPPRAGKSELASLRMPALILGRMPHAKIIS